MREGFNDQGNKILSVPSGERYLICPHTVYYTVVVLVVMINAK